MGVTWTQEQQKVISLRDRNILVSAAAGSGKTAVLVQRILSKIMDTERPVDIDRLLIMTFTRAAAGEMKERISAAIDQILYDNPDNEHLQRQASLIHNAQITTIDGFCAYIIRNYFHMIDLDPGYRTAEEGELKLLREDGYIAMDRYGTVTLMEKGAEIASRIYERHTVLTKMLEGLGVSADTARCDACKMEHDVSDESFEKIKEHLRAKGEI